MRASSHARRTTIGAAALAGAAALVLTGCAGHTTAVSSSGDNTQFVQGNGDITRVAVDKRKPAPALTGKDIDGKPLSLARYKGEVVVLNVWGSWCAPCRAEADGLEATAKEFQGKGVQFVGINTRDTSAGNARAFARTHHLTYPSFYDPSGDLVGEFPPGSLNPQAIPSTLVLDRQGRIAVRALEALTRSQLESMIKPIVAEK